MNKNGCHRFFKGHKNGTSIKYPKNKGGSPSGVKHPAMLDTRKMKKITVWVLYFLCAFIFNNGRINKIEAPVVPTKLAINDAMANRHTFANGVPLALMLMCIPPVMVKRAKISRTKGRYSCQIV